MSTDLTAQVLAIRNGIRKEAGKELLLARPASSGRLAEELRERPAEVSQKSCENADTTAGTLSPAPDSSQPHPPPVPTTETVHIQDWPRTIEKLKVLEPVFTWGFEVYKERDTVFDSLLRLEAACETLAAKVLPKNTETLATAQVLLREEYTACKGKYLQAVGRLCELYLRHKCNLESLDIFSIKFGLKTIRIQVQQNAAGTGESVVEDSVPTFTAREIPALLLSTPAEITRLLNVKEAFPAATVLNA